MPRGAAASAAEGPRSVLGRRDVELLCRIRSSFFGSGRTYGARPVRHDDPAVGRSGGLHRVERLMGRQVMRVRRRLCRLLTNIASGGLAVGLNPLNRQFTARGANRKSASDFIYIWVAGG